MPNPITYHCRKFKLILLTIYTLMCKIIPRRRRELEKRLHKLDFKLNRHGRKHDIWTNSEYEIAVPRQNEINEYTS